MPELPEVETTARSLRPRLIGRRIRIVGGVDWPRMLPNTSEDELRGVLLGLAVTTVDRRGKYLLIGFEDDRWLALHRKMSGNVLLRPAEAAPEAHTHFEMGLDDGWLLRFVDARKFGRVYLFASRADLDAFIAARLGPEPLTCVVGAAALNHSCSIKRSSPASATCTRMRRCGRRGYIPCALPIR